jgi:hypothetical protein
MVAASRYISDILCVPIYVSVELRNSSLLWNLRYYAFKPKLTQFYDKIYEQRTNIKLSM